MFLASQVDCGPDVGELLGFYFLFALSFLFVFLSHSSVHPYTNHPSLPLLPLASFILTIFLFILGSPQSLHTQDYTTKHSFYHCLSCTHCISYSVYSLYTYNFTTHYCFLCFLRINFLHMHPFLLYIHSCFWFWLGRRSLLSLAVVVSILCCVHSNIRPLLEAC